MDLVNYEDQLATDWRDQVQAAVNQPSCSKNPHGCFCDGSCKKLLPKPWENIKQAAASKPLSSFVQDHNAQKPIGAITRPAHYNSTSITALQVIDSWNLNFRTGNAVKYIQRYLLKGSSLADLDKAISYLELEKKRLLDEVIAKHLLT